MSSFTTEETVTTITRTFIKGTFTGKYNAERNDERDSRHSEFYRMNIYSAEIRIEAVRQHNEGDFPEALAVKPFGGTIGQPVRCYDPNSNTYFELTLNEPKINDPVLSLITKEGDEHFGTILGAIFGYITQTATEQVKTQHYYEEPTVYRASSEAGWTRTSAHEFSTVQGISYRRDRYYHAGGNYRWGSWYVVQRGWSLFSLIRLFFGLCFGGLLLAALVHLSWPGLIILGFILLLFFMARWRGTGFGSVFLPAFYLLFILFYIGAIALALFNRKAAYTHPVVSIVPNHRDYSHTVPLKTTPSTRQPDAWIVHHREWEDLQGHAYAGDFKIKRSVYEQASADFSRLSNVDGGLPAVYRTMAMADESRLSGVYPLFDSLKNADHLDSLTFANMLVSFVQDIPYSTVTDGSCSNTDNNGLSASAGQFPASCIGNVPYGVQSPAEFMGNLEGDCDTRTLFLFTVFDHYHYRVAILGSEAFHHSLLGIDLPYPGSAKTAGDTRYVLWETTSKGFAAGHLSPQVDYLDYWNFNLLNTP